MQGQLRNEPLTFTIETHCAHCDQIIRFEMDSQLKYRLLDSSAEPMLFLPMVDFDRLSDPSIIDAY